VPEKPPSQIQNDADRVEKHFYKVEKGFSPQTQPGPRREVPTTGHRKKKAPSPSPIRQRDKKTKTSRCPAASDTTGKNTLKRLKDKKNKNVKRG
jgi:hypothetical protein